MANIILKKQYRCSDDCVQSGCPSHEAKIEYQSVSDAYTFTSSHGVKYFERGELEVFIELLKQLSENRYDAVKL